MKTTKKKAPKKSAAALLASLPKSSAEKTLHVVPHISKKPMKLVGSGSDKPAAAVVASAIADAGKGITLTIGDLMSKDFARPLSCRRVAELKGVTEAAVRKAIASGRLPAPLMLDRSEGAAPQPFFLAIMVENWKPKS